MSYTEDSGDEKVGAAGLEAIYNDELSGKTGRVVTAKTGPGLPRCCPPMRTMWMRRTGLI